MHATSRPCMSVPQAANSGNQQPVHGRCLLTVCPRLACSYQTPAWRWLGATTAGDVPAFSLCSPPLENEQVLTQLIYNVLVNRLHHTSPCNQCMKEEIVFAQPLTTYRLTDILKYTRHEVLWHVTWCAANNSHVTAITERTVLMAEDG